MNVGLTHNHAVLISHCLPDESGDMAQRRAWQLLTLLAQRCQVDLFCLTHGPVHWETYRKVHHTVGRMWVEPGVSLRSRLFGAGQQMTEPHARQVQRLAKVLQEQSWNQSAEVVVCTHSKLALLGYVPPGAMRVCDVSCQMNTMGRESLAQLQQLCDWVLVPESLSMMEDSQLNQQMMVLPPTELSSPMRLDHASLFWSRLGMREDRQWLPNAA